jgi:hypothetical protein
MDNRNRTHENEQENNTVQQTAPNPFENSQPVEKDIEQAQEDLEKEQQFKEALTERD